MRFTLRSSCALMFALMLLAGCQPVREDRSINFASDGSKVGFQHGQEGLYVADSQGAGLRKIFQPTEDMIAVSSPIFAPTDRRLIFTTAKALDGSSAKTTFDALNPAGAVHVQRPVIYTCWLRGPNDDDKPEPLFTAECDHVGYIAANLAVRWAPGGDRVFFLEEVGGRHSVFEIDLATKMKKQAFLKTADAIIFDFAPDEENLVCVLGHLTVSSDDGIWIGKPGGSDWWHVPNSAALATGDLASRIEQLRATKPAWAADGGRFAFASCPRPATDTTAAVHALYMADFTAHTVQKIAESPEVFRDLHWSPDGKELGVVEGKEAGKLRIAKDRVLGPALPTRPVRSFAGWHAHGGHLCYVSPDGIPTQKENVEALLSHRYAFLFDRDLLARDAVYLVGDSVSEAGREVLTGMRVTFPQWSPTEEKLSLWATFAPTERSLLGMFLGSALRPGDPAAVVDLATGRLGWMAVNGHEKAQVGHYYLLKRDFAQAWHWYEEARQGPPPIDDVSFFEYVCLSKLGRHDEARTKLEQFRQAFRPTFSQSSVLMPLFTIADRPREEWLKDLGDPKTFTGQLLRDMYEAEVFLSLDFAADGEAFFRQEMEAAKTDEERYSHAVALGQLLLLQTKNREYAELMGQSLLPLLVKLWDPKATESISNLQFLENLNNHKVMLSQMQQVVLVGTASLTLLPLADPDFLAPLREKQLRACVPHLQSLAGMSRDELSRRGCHWILFALTRRLGMEKERNDVAGQLRKCDSTFSEEEFDEKMHQLLGEIRMMAIGLGSARGELQW
ncbi:MAG TPA: hypothetical protein VGZ47_03270 [Gemmataceae bacterium]|nr:hypothetical protein [Gemmataceae bacterium]